MINQIRVDIIPSVSPNVYDDLKHCLMHEVELYSTNISGSKCDLCPFRSFDRLSRLKSHVQKQHTMKNMYMADMRSPQLAVIWSLYDYHQSIGPVSLSVVENLS